jgi:hypothetical protein
MRKFFYLLLLPMLALKLVTAVNAAEPANLRVEFIQPERFSDFRIEGRDERASAPIFRDEVSSYLSPIVARRFPGDTLTLRFTDIDLGGRAGNRPQFYTVRFNHQFGPPIRMSFDYSVIDEKGTVIANGSKSLLSQDYLHEYLYYPQSVKTSTIFYEKATLAKWVSESAPLNGRLVQK